LTNLTERQTSQQTDAKRLLVEENTLRDYYFLIHKKYLRWRREVIRGFRCMVDFSVMFELTDFTDYAMPYIAEI